MIASILAVPVVATAKEARDADSPQVLSSDSIKVDGQTRRLAGISTVSIDDPLDYATRLYLRVLLDQAPVRCEEFLGRSRCWSGQDDIAGRLVLMGLARSTDGMYDLEQDLAKEGKRGLWK